MVDVDRRNTPTGLTPSHLAGLRRLSARASSSTPAPASTAAALLPDAVLSHLLRLGVPVHPGLSDYELAVLEAEFAFAFPPDLRSLLASGIPSSPGFPDWRCPSSVRSAFRLPVSAVVLLISRHPSLWPRSWGPRPSDPVRAIQTARSALKKSPPLIPIFDRCYIPSTPALSGNPVFYVDEDRVSCCSSDLAEFFHRVGGLGIRSSGSDPELTLQRETSAGEKRAGGPGHIRRRSTDRGNARAPRWVEFWTDMAGSVDRMQRNSSSSSSSSSSSTISTSWMTLSSPDRNSEGPRRRGTPKWVEEYMTGIGAVLRGGGWSEAEVTEMVEVSETGEMVLPDNEAVMDALLVRADRFSESLRKAGWSSEDVSEAFCPDLFRLPPGTGRRPAKELPPEVVERIARLAESVLRS